MGRPLPNPANESPALHLNTENATLQADMKESPFRQKNSPVEEKSLKNSVCQMYHGGGLLLLEYVKSFSYS